MRKEVKEFVAKHRDATRFEDDDGDPGIDFGGEFVEDLKQERSRAVEHAVIVERASATEIGFWHDDAEAGGFEDFDGGFRGAGVEIVIESVWPEKDWRCLCIGRSGVGWRVSLAAAGHRLVQFRRKRWEGALPGDSSDELLEVPQER